MIFDFKFLFLFKIYMKSLIKQNKVKSKLKIFFQYFYLMRMEFGHSILSLYF